MIVGTALKFALLDKVSGSIGDHFFENYLRPAWLDFVVAAFITGSAAIVATGRRTDADMWLLIFFPAIALVICIVLALGFHKAGVDSNMLQVYLPAGIAAASVAIAGGRIAT